MQRIWINALLVLAAAAIAESAPATVRFTPPALSQPGQNPEQIALSCGRRGSMAAVGAVPDGRYAYEVCGNTLRRLDRGGIRYTGSVPDYSGGATVVPGTPVWKRAGVYSLEFAAAGVGALIAEACGLTAIEGAYQAGWNGPGLLPGAAAYCLASAVLSAGGTHLVGKLCGRGNEFKRALAGGAVGGLLGGAAFANYFVTRKNPPSAMIPIGLVLPPLCTVIVYNVWRNDGAK